MTTNVELMSNEELHNALASIRADRGYPPEASVADDNARAVHRAFVRSALNKPADDDPHPIVEGLLRQGRFGLASAARALSTGIGRGDINATGNQVLALGMSTDHLPNMVASVAEAVLKARPSPGLADIRAITHDTVVPDYREAALGLVDVDIGLPDEASDGVFLALMPKSNGRAVQVHSTHARLILSEQLLQNDDANFLPSSLTAFQAAAVRAEQAGLAALLESDQLSDGEQLFIASNSASGFLDSVGLSTAVAALRQQPSETGAATGAQPHAIIVHPEDEISALELMNGLPEDRRMRVVTLPLTQRGPWYLMADPQVSPTLVRARLAGSDASAISTGTIGPARWHDESGELRSTPGIGVDAVHTVGLAAVSRVGLVRVQ